MSANFPRGFSHMANHGRTERPANLGRSFTMPNEGRPRSAGSSSGEESDKEDKFAFSSSSSSAFVRPTTARVNSVPVPRHLGIPADDGPFAFSPFAYDPTSSEFPSSASRERTPSPQPVDPYADRPGTRNPTAVGKDFWKKLERDHKEEERKRAAQEQLAQESEAIAAQMANTSVGGGKTSLKVSKTAPRQQAAPYNPKKRPSIKTHFSFDSAQLAERSSSGGTSLPGLSSAGSSSSGTPYFSNLPPSPFTTAHPGSIPQQQQFFNSPTALNHPASPFQSSPSQSTGHQKYPYNREGGL